MSTSKSLTALEKTKEAVSEITRRLKPVLERLQREDAAATSGTEPTTSATAPAGEAEATIALSIGMMRYMGARLRGLDQGRKPDDPLRIELNTMKRVLAEIKKKNQPHGNPSASSPSPTTGAASDPVDAATTLESTTTTAEVSAGVAAATATKGKATDAQQEAESSLTIQEHVTTTDRRDPTTTNLDLKLRNPDKNEPHSDTGEMSKKRSIIGTPLTNQEAAVPSVESTKRSSKKPRK
jgi:hypothetical protein